MENGFKWVRSHFALLLCIILALHVVIRLSLSWALLDTPVTGDERYAWSAYIAEDLFYRENFLPGNSIFLRWFSPLLGESLPKARIMMVLAGIGTLALVLIAMKYALGPIISLCLGGISLLFIDFHTMSFGLWGEHLFSLLLIAFISLLLLMTASAKISNIRFGILLAGLAVTYTAALYLRQNATMLAPISTIYILIVLIQNWLSERKVHYRLLVVPAMVFLNLLVLTPWWNFLEETVGHPQTHASSVDVSLAVHYGYEPLEQINPAFHTYIQNECEVPQALKRNPFNSLNYCLNRYTENSSIKRYDLLQDLRASALATWTPSHVMSNVNEAFGRLIFLNARFSDRLLSSTSAQGEQTASRSWIPKNIWLSVSHVLVPIMYFLSFAYCVFGFLERGNRKYQHILFFGVFTLSNAIVLLHQTNERHYIAFLPLFILGGLLMFRLSSDIFARFLENRKNLKPVTN